MREELITQSYPAMSDARLQGLRTTFLSSPELSGTGLRYDLIAVELYAEVIRLREGIRSLVVNDPH